MIFTFKAYNDLGRCSYGTLLESFDTEKDEILLNGYKLKIERVEDLFPYLWQSPGTSVRAEDRTCASFTQKGTHWHQDFDSSIEREKKRQEDLRSRIAKSSNPKKIGRLTFDLSESEKHQRSLERILEWCDKEMEEQKEELIRENRR